MSLVVKVHTKNERTIVAVCDKDLVGTLIEDGDVQLDLRSDFFAGDEMDLKEVGDLVRNADGVNLVGDEAVKVGLQEDVIDESHIMKVDGTPYAQAVVVQD